MTLDNMDAINKISQISRQSRFPFQFRENYTFSTQHFESKCITFDFEYLLGSFATIFFNVPSRWHKSTAARTSLYIRE